MEAARKRQGLRRPCRRRRQRSTGRRATLRLAAGEVLGRQPAKLTRSRDASSCYALDALRREAGRAVASCSRRRTSAARNSRNCCSAASSCRPGCGAGAATTAPIGGQQEMVRWVEVVRPGGCSFNATPLQVARIFPQARSGQQRARLDLHLGHAVREAAISRTTSADGARAGATRDAGTAPSTIARRRCSTCRRACRSRTASGYTEAVVDAALPVLGASGGRAFLLFTSLRAMRACARAARRGSSRKQRPRLPAAAAGRGLAQRAAGALPQARQRGAGGKPVVLGRRGRARRGALAGRDRRAAVRAARRSGARRAHRALESRRAATPSWSTRCRSAVITLKQGAGRLIRDETDRGVLMICDPRLVRPPLRQAHLAEPAADAAHAPVWRRWSRIL